MNTVNKLLIYLVLKQLVMGMREWSGRWDTNKPMCIISSFFGT